MFRIARSEPTSRCSSRFTSSAWRNPEGEKVAISLATSLASSHSSVNFWETSRRFFSAAWATPRSPLRAERARLTSVSSSSR